MPTDVALGGIVLFPKAAGEGIGVYQETSITSKICSHFIKGKISLSPMETIFMIPRELEHLESLVRLARKKKCKGNKQSSVYGFSNSNTQANLHQQNTHKQNPPLACGNKQLCGGRTCKH